MKKFLIFIGGFVAGIIATILVAFLFLTEPDDGLSGLMIFPEKGECIASININEIVVFQVLEPNMALASAVDTRNFDRITVLLVNHEGKTYFDQQRIEIPANKCARKIGTYRYTAEDGRVRTVPVVVIEYR